MNTDRFYELHLDEKFEILELGKGKEHHHKFLIRCKGCGEAHWHQDDVLRKQTKSIWCPFCGNTNYVSKAKPYIKKGYHTPEAIAARKKTVQKITAIRRQQGEDIYRQKVESLGVDFTYLRRDWSKPHKMWVICNRCGAELLRGDDVIKGKANNFRCDKCGNGMKAFSDFANEVLDFYQNGHSQQETIEKFGVSKNELQTWAKRRGVTNGRTISEINREKAAVGAAKVIAKSGIKFEQKMSEQGFDLVSEYRGKDTKVTLRCQKCGSQFERTIGSANHGVNCPFCLEEERKARKQELEKKKLADKLLREAEKTKREEEKNRKFDEIHLCKVCGKEYTPRQYMGSCGLKFFSNPGYCSKTCRVNWGKRKKKPKNRKKSHCKHYSRAKKLGLPVEKGVTLPKLYKRDNGICQICGMVCVYSDDWRSDLYPSMDHIIPLNNDPLKQGGHTWKNVQLAHRICNSNKRDYVGKEWHNDAC